MVRYLILLAALSLLLVSCGGNDRGIITLTWWQFWTDAEIKPVIRDIVGRFESQHPGIEVELVDLTWADGHDKIAIAFSSGSGPDIVELGSDWVPEFSTTGHLLDISDMVDSITDQYLMWDPAIRDSGYFAFPWILGTRILYVNSELLVRAGYEPDFSPRTWDELYGAADKINHLDGKTFGFGSNSAERHRLYKKFLPFFWSNGAAILSEDGQSCLLDEPAAVDALKYYLKLCRTGLTDTQRRLEDAFIEGHIGFIISGDWLLKRIAHEKPEMAFTTHLIPGPGGPASSRSFAGGEYLAVNVKARHPEQAMALIRHICSAENQLRFCLANRTATPSSIAAADDSVFLSQPHFETFVRQMKTAMTPPAHPKWVYIEGILEKAIESALYGTVSPEQAFDEACRKIEELLAE